MGDSLLGISRHSLTQSDERNQWSVYVAPAQGYPAPGILAWALWFWLSAIGLPVCASFPGRLFVHVPYAPFLEGSADLGIMCCILFRKNRATQKPQLGSWGPGLATMSTHSGEMLVWGLRWASGIRLMSTLDSMQYPGLLLLLQTFWGSAKLFSITAASFCTSTTVCESSNFSISLHGAVQFVELLKCRLKKTIITEVYFTYHKIHPFKVYSGFSIVPKLCNHHFYLLLEYSHHPQKRPCTL